MQVSEPNNIKIYNLSAGKSLPEWLSERKRRALQRKNIDIRRRIELIQDFAMPGVSTSVKISRDGSYIFATGIYKPRVRCFDVNHLSQKFEQCFDSEVVTFEVLSEDYSKIVFLRCDRYIEFHCPSGKYYRLRMPKFGRDLAYHSSSCDLLLVGSGSEIYRLNLERGQYMNPMVTESVELNRCALNPDHNLFVCGTQEGKIEAWDLRTRQRVGILDCAINCMTDSVVEGFPSVTAVKFQGGLTLGVGTATGQVLLYDIRSSKPFQIKDHMYGLPILDVDFHYDQDLVYSMDKSILKIWNKHSGKNFTFIEAASDFNNLCVYPKSGLMFIANESPKILTYYIPSLGPAPKWCGFLDNLTEELEESNVETVYEDYKFVTKNDLKDLGLDHLIGTNLLRSFMHGYFMDIRLYKRIKLTVNPFEFEEYKKKKIKERIEEDRLNRVKLEKLPKVNKSLALKLMNEEEHSSKLKKKTLGPNLLKDERFKTMFENPDFEVDPETEEYRLLHPVLSTKLQKQEKKLKKLEKQQQTLVADTAADADADVRMDSDMASDISSGDSSSEDEWLDIVEKKKEMARERRLMQTKKQYNNNPEEPRKYKLHEGESMRALTQKFKNKRNNRLPLGRRLDADMYQAVKVKGTSGNKEMTFSIHKEKRQNIEEKRKLHHEMRKKICRPAHKLFSKSKGKFGRSKR